MATKQEVADYINANYESAWSKAEETKIDQMLTPELHCWIHFIIELKIRH